MNYLCYKYGRVLNLITIIVYEIIHGSAEMDTIKSLVFIAILLIAVDTACKY